MTDEQEVLRSFRAMDDETQMEARMMFRNLARDFPRAARLQLVRNVDTGFIPLHPSGDRPKPPSILLGK